MPSALPATQNEGGCRQVPRLPRKVQVDVAKCHAYHANCHGVTARPMAPKQRPSTPQSQPSAISAPPATQNEGGCRRVPRLPRKVKVDVAKCHGCHAKQWWISSGAKPATQSEGGCRQVPLLLSVMNEISCRNCRNPVRCGMLRGLLPWRSCLGGTRWADSGSPQISPCL